MQKNFSVPRGTSDILPNFIPLWETVESTARRICKSYGYQEIRTPIYEETALFKRSLGQTSDVVNKQLLELAHTKDEGYALRPEGTAAIVRSYIENSLDKKEPLSKLFYMGPMFRGERPQKGRLRQFHQIGVEAIGPNSESPLLDAEIIILAMHLLEQFGVKGSSLRINSLGSKEDKENISAWLRKEFGQQKQHLCEDCQGRYERNVFRVLDCKNESCRKIVLQVVKNLPLSQSSAAYFNAVKKSLDAVGVKYEIAPHLVRGLDYYTHTVFEITAAGLGSQDAVGAGGRYSGLLHELGASEKVTFGAIGFALGIERVLLARGQEELPAPSIDAYVIAMDEAYLPQAFFLISQLRQASISADMSYAAGSMKSQMGRANKANAKFALILGEDEIKNKSVAIKDMNKAIQTTVLLDQAVAYVKERVVVS